MTIMDLGLLVRARCFYSMPAPVKVKILEPLSLEFTLQEIVVEGPFLLGCPFAFRR